MNPHADEFYQDSRPGLYQSRKSRPNTMPLEISPAPLTTTHNDEDLKLRAPVGVPLTEWIELRQSRFRARMGKRQGTWMGASSTDRHKSKYTPSVSRSSFSRSIDSRSADSTTMRQDAREIFDEYGITRPEGWLSEANSGGDDGDRTCQLKNAVHSYQVCHSCRRPIAGKICPACGHDSCIKCTSEMPLEYHPLSNLTANSGVNAIQDPLRTQIRLPRDAPSHSLPTKRSSSRVLRQSSSRSKGRGSTPRPKELKETSKDLSASVGNEESVIPRKRTIVKAGTSVRNNPFIQADRGAKAFASNPQASNEQAHAIQPYRLSDCIPRRSLVRSASQSSVKKTGIAMNSLTTAPTHDNEYNDTRYISTGKVSIKTKVIEGGNVADSVKQHKTSQGHGATISDPLQRKIDQLYQHAEDLNKSQHIMDHLAIGTRKLHRYGIYQQRARRLASQPVPSDVRLHSMGRDRKEDVSYSEYGHDIQKDDTTLVIGNTDVQRVHSLPTDQPEHTESLFPGHDLADDKIPPSQPSPKSTHLDPAEFEVVKQSVSKKEDSHLTRLGQPPHTNLDEMSSQRPGPEAVPDFPRAKLRSSYTESTPNLPKEPVKLPSGYHISSSSSFKLAEQTQAESQLEKDASGSFMASKYERQEPHNPYLHLPDEAYHDAWPRLKNTRRPTMEKPHPDTDILAPWTKKSLRRVSEDPEVHTLHHDPANANLIKMRQHLRRVEIPPNDESPKPSRTPPLEWHRSLSRFTRTPQTQGEKEYDCGFCNPSQETSSNNEEPGASIAVEDVDAKGYSRKAVSKANAYDYSQPRDELLEQTSSRLKLRDLENSLARHSAEELLKDQAERKSAERTVRSPLRTVKEMPAREVAPPMLRNPKPFLPPDHACEWRARCMDLSSEVEQLKSEMNSHEDTSEAIGSLRVGRIDVGVGNALARHECDEFGIEGLTIVLHMRGKDDLVINTDLEKESPVYKR